MEWKVETALGAAFAASASVVSNSTIRSLMP
jgi:hypothetical protein